MEKEEEKVLTFDMLNLKEDRKVKKLLEENGELKLHFLFM
jgi:hypothetical protein